MADRRGAIAAPNGAGVGRSGGTVSFPPYIAKKLAEPPPSPRHDAWRDMAYSMVGERIPDDVIFDTLRAWIPDRDKPGSELRAAIKSAHHKNPQPSTTNVGVYRAPGRQTEQPKVKPFQSSGTRMALPTNLAKTTPGEFLSQVFHPDDYVCVAFQLNQTDVVHTARDWSLLYEQGPSLSSRPDGVWFTTNPLLDHESQRKDTEVADFRYCLVELEVPKPERANMSADLKREACERFYATLHESGLPIAAIYLSGDASVHALVNIGASGVEQWKERVALVYQYCGSMPGLDKGNKNPSRLSRLPGAFRDGACQSLLSWNVGPASWDEWQPPIDDGLPKIETFGEMNREAIAEPEQLIKNLLHKGSKMVIGGSSKMRKTWLVTDLGISIASGAPWLGFEATQGKVLFANLEIQKYFIRDRAQKIATAKGLRLADFEENLHFLNLRGFCGDAAKILPIITERVRTKEYAAIILDPTYKLLGNRDENKAGDITGLLNEFEKLAVESGAATVCTAHFSKGNQSARDAIDRISGSGVFARDPDTIFITTAHQEPDALVIDSILRNFPPINPFVVRWNNWLFEKCDLDPAKLKSIGRRPQEFSDAQILELLESGQGLTTAEVAEKLNMSDDTAGRRLKKLADAGLVQKTGKRWYP